METKYGDLEIEEDMSFQKRTWIVERLGWALMALLVLASVLGLIGTGPLSNTRKGDPARLQIEFERFTHANTPTRLRVRLAVDGPFFLQLPVQYLRKTEVSEVLPEPETVAAQGELVTYSFAAERGSAEVIFDLKIRQWGSRKGFVQSAQGRVDFTQYVYP
jgi:hypothetical protein